MAESLAVKYRPKEFEDVVQQASTIRILMRQLELEQYAHCYLFAGASGCGKTTLARLFANKINKGMGSPIEIDAASNNGVDNIKAIIKSAQERSIDSKYKVYIIDECHSLTNQAWQAMLKCIEEPPTYTIFIFCTTDPQKIPETIKNRVQRYSFSRISTDNIQERLRYICCQEGFTNFEESIDYIAKIAEGGMRTAISYLDKCACMDPNLNIQNVLNALGNYSYKTFFTLLNNMIDGNEANVLNIINDFYEQGNDLKLFIDQYLNFCLDVTKYSLFQRVDATRIPSSMEPDLKNVVNFDNASRYYTYLIDRLLNLKQCLKNDDSPRSTIEIMMLQMTRCA